MSGSNQASDKNSTNEADAHSNSFHLPSPLPTKRNRTYSQLVFSFFLYSLFIINRLKNFYLKISKSARWASVPRGGHVFL